MPEQWPWIRGPGQPGFANHSRRLDFAGDAQTPVGVDLFLPVGHVWDTMNSPNRSGRSYGKWVFAKERCHQRAELLWAHLSTELVSPGRRYDARTRGIKLGETGQSGDVSGAHLHFETDRDFWAWTERIWTPEEEMTQEEFNAMLDKALTDQANDENGRERIRALSISMRNKGVNGTTIVEHVKAND